MSEASFVLSYTLATLVALTIGGLALFALTHAKNRIIAQQRQALEAEQRMRRTQEAFSDNAHHELRTPIHILGGHLQMLQDLDPRPDQAEILTSAQDTAKQLGQLMQDLLDLSSLAQGSLSTSLALTDLGPHLAGLAQDFEVRTKAKGLELRVELDPLPQALICDAPRLCQALKALLDNALGFTQHGTISFRMTAHPDGRLWHLRFEVEDQGQGLPADWERLLRPFEQEEQGLHRRRGGLGIGLPLTAGIIEVMGGRMGLQPMAIGSLAWVELRLEEVGV